MINFIVFLIKAFIWLCIIAFIGGALIGAFAAI